MNRLATSVAICLWLMIPATARADDGGWLDWLYGMDPKFWGLNSEIHVLCLKANGDIAPCERWFHLPRIFGADSVAINYDEIKHEFDFRFGVYFKYGEPDTSMSAVKLMAMYRYHVSRVVSLGVGAGYMPFFGDDGFKRKILTPFSVIIAPVRTGKWRSFYIRGEDSYLGSAKGGTNAANPFTAFATRGEWNPSLGIGFDFRR